MPQHFRKTEALWRVADLWPGEAQIVSMTMLSDQLQSLLRKEGLDWHSPALAETEEDLAHSGIHILHPQQLVWDFANLGSLDKVRHLDRCRLVGST